MKKVSGLTSSSGGVFSSSGASSFGSGSRSIFSTTGMDIEDTGGEPASFKCFQGTNCLCALVRIVGERDSTKYHNEIMQLKRTQAFSKFYLMKRTMEKNGAKSPSHMDSLRGNRFPYYLEYLSGTNNNNHYRFELEQIKSLKSERSKQFLLHLEIIDSGGDGQESIFKKTYGMTIQFKYSRDLDSFESIISRIHEILKKDEKERGPEKEFEYYRPSNRIIPQKKSYRKMVKKEHVILTTPFSNWKKEDVVMWLSVLPFGVDEKSSGKKVKINSIYDILKRNHKKRPSYYSLFEKYVFPNDSVINLMELRDRLKNENLAQLLKYPKVKDGGGREVVDDTLRKLGMYLRRYLTILEFVGKNGAWSYTFGKVLNKLIINNFHGVNKKSLLELLESMMDQNIILWDADECRDHVLSLMLFDRPFINHDLENPDDTFGNVWERNFWAEVKKMVEKRDKQPKAEEIEGEEEEEEEKEKKLQEGKVKWKELKNSYVDYKIFKIRNDDEELIKLFFDNEERFIDRFLSLPTPPKDLLRIKEEIMKMWKINLENISYKFYTKMKQIERIIPSWDEIQTLKRVILEKHETCAELIKKAKTPESDFMDDFPDDMMDADEMLAWAEKFGAEESEEGTGDGSVDGEDLEKVEKEVKEKLNELKEALVQLADRVKYGDQQLISGRGKQRQIPKWQFFRSKIRRKEIYKLLETEMKNIQEFFGPLEIVVKLVLSELACFKDINMPYRRLLLKCVDKFLKIPFYKFGFIHSSIILKNVQFHWYANQFVNIKHIKKKDDQNEFFCVDCYCPLISEGYHFFELVDIFCQRIIQYNTFTPYDCWGVSNTKTVAKNCQQVTLKLLEKLEYTGFYGISEEYFDSIKKIIERKFSSTEDFPLRFLDLKWSGAKEFAKDERFKSVWEKRLNLAKYGKGKIVFHSHRELDTFFNEILLVDAEFSILYPGIFEVLKGIDRGFQLLKEKKGNNEFIMCHEEGCPFNEIHGRE